MLVKSAPTGNGTGTGDLVTPFIIVLLVLMLGATMYLWRARYIRRKSAYVMIGAFGLLLILVSALSYRSGS